MNRIKHTLLLALALLMSVGAWAQPSYHIVGSGQGNWMHGIGWVIDAPENEMAYENGIFTITFENVQPGTHEFLFHNGEMLIGKDMSTMSTENHIQFNTSLGVYEGGGSYTFELTAAADVTVTLDVSNQNWTCMVVVEQGISQDQALNWLFTMPDYDADMRLVWKAPADLAWNDVPDGGVSGYRGFHNLVTFPTLANPHSLPVRYGVTDTTIASIDNEGNIVFLAAGEAVVYAIHDFDADYDFDSVTYHLTVLQPATFTLANNEGGIFEVAGGLSDSVIAAEDPNLYYAIPGATITVQATPDSAHYLARFDSDSDTNSNAPVEKTYTVNVNTTSTATFTHKPLFTLNSNEGGRIEAIVPQGGGEETLLTTVTATGMSTYSQSPDGVVTVEISGNDSYGEAWGWYRSDEGTGTVTVTAAEGYTITRCVFKQDPSEYPNRVLTDDLAPFVLTINGAGMGVGSSFVEASNGQQNGGEMDGTSVIEVYGYQNATAGNIIAAAGNIIAAAEENTYIVDYGTDVTVVATPDSAHYLARFDSDADTNSNAAVEKTYTNITSNTTATAHFTAKPLFTLNSTEGGRIEAIVPQVGLIVMQGAMVPDGWAHDYNTNATAVEMQAMGLVAVDQAVAEAWADVPQSGWARLLYDFASDGRAKFVLFYDGSVEDTYTDYYSHGFFSDDVSEGKIYLATGVSNANVTPSATANQYYVDYGTDVTVQATPDSAHYLARFDSDADTNSNAAVEKTYTGIISNTTSTATFAHKPLLTLNSNEGGRIEAIVPQGGAIAEQLSNETINTWQDGDTPLTTSHLPGFVAVGSAAAATWTDAPQSHDCALFYKVDGTTWYYAYYIAGVYSGESSHSSVLGNVYNMYHNDLAIYYTTGVTVGNIIAAAEENTYIVDYGTDVTVQAEPDQHYHLASWSNNVTPGADSTAALNMTEDQTVVATFEKNAPELAWMYRGAEMPAEGVVAYHGFETDTIMLISSTANDEFYMARRQDGAEIHFGSTDTSVASFTDATNPLSITINGAGTTTIYMVHDGSLMAYDSVAFNVTLLAPDTLVLDTTGFGTVAVEMNGASAENGIDGISLMAQVYYYDDVLETDFLLWQPVLSNITLPYSTTLRQLCDTVIKIYGDNAQLDMGSNFAKFGDVIVIKNELSSVNPNATVGDMIGNYQQANNDVNITITDTGVVQFAGNFYHLDNEMTYSNSNVGPFRVVVPVSTNDSIRAIVSTAGRVYNGPVDINTLREGDILVTGFELYANEGQANVHVNANRYKSNGQLATMDDFFNMLSMNNYGSNGSFKYAGNTYTPATENGEDGSAWVVTATNQSSFYHIYLSGINYVPEKLAYAVVPGANVTINATAGERYHMASWSNGVEVNDILNASQTITIASDSTIVANFEHNPILTLATEGLGTVAIENLGPKTHLGLTVGDIIRVGDKVEIPSTSNDVRVNNAANMFKGYTYELIRANVYFDDVLNDIVVTPAEDGEYYVFSEEGSTRYVLYDFDQFYSEFDYRMPVTEMSDGFIVTSYDGYQGGYDKYTLTVHEGNGTPAPAANNNIVADSNNTYSVVPGTQVVVKATPDKYNHLTSWSNNYIVNETLTDTFVVNHSLTLTASFEKNDPELAWTYRGAEMPAQGVTAYHGFETDTIMLISSTANDEFYMARRQDSAEIHFGSTNTSVASFADATNPLSITINGAGTTTIYMVHDGSLMAYDSAYFTVNLLAPDTLTLVYNNGGEMTVEMGASNGGLLTTLYANGSALGTTTTNDTVSLAIEGHVMYNASTGWLAEYGAGNEGSITVTAENGFSIDSCVFYFSAGSSRPYTISQAPFAVYPACPSSSRIVCSQPGGQIDYEIGHEGVTRIEVYGRSAATNDSIRAISENAYAAVPGAIATVKATPDSVHYIVNFDNDAAINSNIAATKSYTVNGNTTSNVTFNAKPILTLNQTEGGELEVVMPEGGVAATHITSDQIPTWQGSYDPVMEADLQPFGFVPVDSATARTWTGAPAVGDAYLIYDFTGEYYKAHLFRDGQLADWANDYFYKGNFYQFANLAYFTTGADMGTGNITAAAEANKYYVDYGTDVTVQATPDKHYHLALWSNNVTPGADSTAALNMTEDQTVTATFEKNAPELAWRYRRDTMPAEGVTAYLGFTADSIMLIGTTANDEFLMAYAEEDADLHFGSTNTNVVSFADANDPMSITVNGVGTTTIYMVHNGSLMAYDSVTFPVTILQPATLTIAANGNGTLVVDTVSDSIITTATEGRYHVVHGANINLTSTPADKHYMQTWNDVDTAINSNVVVNRTITVTSDTTITATFAHKPIITLASSDTAWGSVKVQLTNYEQLPEGVVVMEGFENRYIIDYGLRVTLVATATEMHHVSHWVDQNVDSLFAAIYREYFVTDPVDLYPATSRLSFIVTVDTTAKAIFGVNCFDVDASVAPHSFSGTAEITYIDVVDSTLSTGANAVVHAVAKGSTTATITATPATGYHFVGWKDNMNEEPETDTLITENPVSVNVMTNYTAVFDTNVYDITVNIDSIEGSVEGPATVKHFLRGTYTATATPCYHFVNWTNEAGDTISTNPTLTIAAISDSAVTANFELNIYTGDTTAVECDQFVWHGITYTATPEEEPTFVYKNHNNCDSTVTLHLTINYHHDTTIYRQASGGFTFLDNYYTENTTDTLTIETVLHCDSNITLVLAVLPHTTPLPVIYNLMDVALTIDHFEGDTGHIDYIFYRWYKDGAIVSEGIDMDSYSEEGTILNGCYHLEISTDEEHQYWATSNEICVGTTGIDDVEAITLTVAPNPVMHGNKANITVNGAANLQGATATVYDAQGRKVLEFGVQNSTFEIQTSNLVSGIYTVRIVLSDGRMATRKLVVR